MEQRAYPAPPWTYVGARVLNVVCRAAEPRAVHRWIPAPLRPARDDGLFTLWFASVPSIPEVGPHYTSAEGGICIPAQTADGAARGGSFALIVVDNDVALCGGREIWGFPKRMGAVRFDADGSRSVSAAIHQTAYRDGRGAPILSVEATLDGSGEEALALLPAFEPRLLKRTIPSPFGPEREADGIVRVGVRSVVVHELRTGRAEVRLGPGLDGLDEWGPVTVLGAVHRHCDFVLPYGEPVSG
ncbi:acetoacetate decarboxylase family protein [Azospirillum sp.]|uniref:acetoacetate decarboxylase family protein n=1 Tax=Azospirillum sp. TaxID=34012 RepID=UPI002D24D203|nr:acetoacetate decarboxylase family protein [Azospirillum sp.]HYD66845.1 acetoacetate decarboxylase family protein [Azospirillum sp.]